MFIAGTDTDAGKTCVACAIARTLVAGGYRVGVYKPVASGTEHEPTDVQRLAAAAQVHDLDQVCPQQFRAPLAPHLAAREEGTQVDEGLLITGLTRWTQACDLVIVEGVGGLMSPVSASLYCADLVREFNYPLVVVAPNRLGVINHALQTLVVARTLLGPAQLAGLVINNASASLDLSAQSNPWELAARCGVPILAHLEFGQEVCADTDWWQLAGRGAA